ncbi:MAG: HepT-like ribonuclease domain-containing protein [Bradyrhizobium sp.]
MVEALESVARFTEGRGQGDLDTDTQLIFALLYAIQVVGEAADKISQETRAAHPEIPWPAIIGMRHRLVHAYANIDHDILWTTVTEAAPRLPVEVRKALEAL